MSWPEVALGEVADVNWGDTSVTKKSYSDEGFTAFSATGPDGFLPYHDFDREGVVLSAIGARCGKTWFAQGKWSVIKNTIRFWSERDDLDNRFLYWLTANPDFWPKRGAAQPFITIGDARALKIPLPPLEEQKRIAGILDQAAELCRLRTRALDKLGTLGQAIFHEMFGDMKANTKGWDEIGPLGQFADVASGITKGRKTNGENLREVPYLAVSNVQDQYLKMDVVKTIEATSTEIERYLLKRDDLLLTEGGDPDKLGRGTIWRDELDECIHQNHVFRVRVADGPIRPIFLSWQLGSTRGKSYFLRSAKQTTGIASINKNQLNEFPVLAPTMDLQIKFEKCLENATIEVQRLVRADRSSQTLFASLQHRAFRGEL